MIASVTVSSVGKLAKALDVSSTMARTYLDMGMPGADEQGEYDVDACLAWQAAMRASSSRPTKGGKSGDLREEKLSAEIDKLAEEVRRKRLDNDRLEGTLVRRDDVVAEFADFLSEAKPILESLPDDFAKEVAEEYRVVARSIAKVAIERAFRKLASWQPKLVDEVEDE